MYLDIQKVFIKHLALLAMHHCRPIFTEFTFDSFDNRMSIKKILALFAIKIYWAPSVDLAFCQTLYIEFSFSSRACLL